MKLRLVGLAWVLPVLLFSWPVLGQDSAPLEGMALVSALRQGGYIIYFRHAATEWSQSDRAAAEGDWASCDPARMRQLAPEGRAVARQIGEALRALGVPVGRVVSSEYCRCVETARLMGLGEVTATTRLFNFIAAGLQGGEDAVRERAKGLLSERPAPGTNTVLVAHGNLLQAAARITLKEAGAALFEPLGERGFRHVATLNPEDWQELARRFGSGR
jgi:broad specificity phosphatase PhoE